MKALFKVLVIATLLFFISSSTMGKEQIKKKEQLKPTPKNLLNFYNKKQAIRTREIIEKCKKRNNYSPRAMTIDVAPIVVGGFDDCFVFHSLCYL